MFELKFARFVPLKNYQQSRSVTMANHYMNSALSHYRQNTIAGAAVESDPRKLIEMLLGGAIDRLAHARGSMMRADVAAKHHYISSTISIIEHLRMILDLPAGGEIAHNLMRLYDYMLRRLAAANAGDDPGTLDEVAGLLREIKSAWDEMPLTASTQH
jgi:flagellar secretion chaperone FliS